MLAVQFGGSDNIWVDCRNHSATGESWRGAGVCLGEIYMCVCVCGGSQRGRGFLSPPPPQEAGERAGQVGSSSKHTVVSSNQSHSVLRVPLTPLGNSIGLVRPIVS